MDIPERAPAHSLDIAGWTLVFLCWWFTGLATLGALYLSVYREIEPCVLCGYQRMFMFPLVPILFVGLFTFDRRVIHCALSLAIIGWLIAVFHLLLITGVVPEAFKPCPRGVPCSELQITWFGFVTVPLLSVAAFSLITVLLVAAHVRNSK